MPHGAHTALSMEGARLPGGGDREEEECSRMLALLSAELQLADHVCAPPHSLHMLFLAWNSLPT